MQSVVKVDPFRCRMWEFHDRLDAHINERTCRDEIESVSRHGQLVPALGRPLRDDQTHDVELIYGARRLFVARHLNKPLAVEIRTMCDKEALIAMDLENRVRRDISPYERALSYAHWIRSEHFNSQEELAKTLKVSASQVSRILKLSKLPAIVIAAFEDPTVICEDWGIKLITILDNTDKRRRVLDAARAIAAKMPRLPANDVYRQLLTASLNGKKTKARHRDLVVRDSNGNPLFRVRQHRELVAILLPVERVAESTIKEITAATIRILQAATP